MTTWDLIFIGGLIAAVSATSTLILIVALCRAAARGDRQQLDLPRREVFTEEYRDRATQRLRDTCS